MKIRALYTPDVRFNTMLIFELRGNKFVCITDEEIQYDLDMVLSDDDWIIFSIDEEEDGTEYVYNIRS